MKINVDYIFNNFLLKRFRITRPTHNLTNSESYIINTAYSLYSAIATLSSPNAVSVIRLSTLGLAPLQSRLAM